MRVRQAGRALATALAVCMNGYKLEAMKSAPATALPQASFRRPAPETGRSSAVPSELVFPVVRGVQAQREYYVSMCPLRLIPELFLFDEVGLTPELRAQRTLNRPRIPEIAKYMVENRNDYVFSAITASIDADVRFEPFGRGEEGWRSGLLRIPAGARFVLNDGQHRRAAVEMAIRECPAIADETIAVVFFVDIGLERSQQMFADLNRHAVRPSRSLGVLYDHRDDRARLAKLVVFRSPAFQGLVELERSCLSERSHSLFTLSAIALATSVLIAHAGEAPIEDLADLAAGFWATTAEAIEEWRKVRAGEMVSGTVRRDYIHSTSVVLEAIASAGSALIQVYPHDWRDKLKALGTIDWARSNTQLWEGRAMTAGVMTKSRAHVALIANVIKRSLGLELTPEDRRVEDAFTRGEKL